MDIDELLRMLGMTPKQQSPYVSVLGRNMDNPQYRQSMEQQQGLEGVYPELWMMGRGSGMAPRAELSAGGIGSKVPASYKPFTELSPSEQRLILLRQKNLTRMDQQSMDPDFLREFFNMTLDRNRGTLGNLTLQHILQNQQQ